LVVADQAQGIVDTFQQTTYTDDIYIDEATGPLAGVTVPTSGTANPVAGTPSHLQQVRAQLVSGLAVNDTEGQTHSGIPDLRTERPKRTAQSRRQVVLASGPDTVECSSCSGCSFSDAAAGPDPDRLPVAGFRDAPV
jgi:hypothetical protein